MWIAGQRGPEVRLLSTLPPHSSRANQGERSRDTAVVTVVRRRATRNGYDRPVVEEGQQAPDFRLESDAGEQVSLSQFRGTPVVLYFYPADDTPFRYSQ